MPKKVIKKVTKKNIKNKKGKPTKSKKTKTKLPAKLVKYLEDRGIKHEILEHKTVYTAFDAANTLKKKINEIAKSLLIKADKDYYLVILPADQNVDFEKLKKFISKMKARNVKTVMIPGEKVMSEALKLKKEALSAFGKLHELEVIMEKKLTNSKKAVFSSGSYNHSIEMAVKDFINLENAILANIGVKKKVKLVKRKK